HPVAVTGQLAAVNLELIGLDQGECVAGHRCLSLGEPSDSRPADPPGPRGYQSSRAKNSPGVRGRCQRLVPPGPALVPPGLPPPHGRRVPHGSPPPPAPFPPPFLPSFGHSRPVADRSPRSLTGKSGQAG